MQRPMWHLRGGSQLLTAGWFLPLWLLSVLQARIREFVRDSIRRHNERRGGY